MSVENLKRLGVLCFFVVVVLSSTRFVRALFGSGEGRGLCAKPGRQRYLPRDLDDDEGIRRIKCF